MTKLLINNIAIIYSAGWISFPLPIKSFMTGYIIKPIAMPSAILYVNGINTIIKSAGKLSVKSSIEMFTMFCNIRTPIKIRIGETALAGTTFITGINKIETKNITPVTILVSPVLPPAVIPAADSTEATVGLVPKTPEDKTETAVA